MKNPGEPNWVRRDFSSLCSGKGSGILQVDREFLGFFQRFDLLPDQ
jgi:hypothetical protein